MSRDQRPGRVKLVAGAAANPGRRIDDPSPGESAAVVPLRGSAPQQAGAGKGPGLLGSLLFLTACAGGAAGAVYLGFAEIASR